MSIKSIDGIPIVDAKHRLTLHILPRDCTKGNPKEPETCAAARTLMREHHATEVRVHVSRVYVRRNPGNWQRYLTSSPLRTELIAFDRGGRFEPGTYTLLVPYKATGKRQGTPSRNKTAAERRAAKHRLKPLRAKNVRHGPAQFSEA